MATHSSHRTWYIIGGLAVVLIGGLLLAKAMGWLGQEPINEVTFAKARRTDITERVSASGKVQPELEVKLSPEVSGEITHIYVKEGDSVRAGQLLLRIRPDNYESFVSRGQAAVNQSRAAVEQAHSTLAQAEARLLRASADYNRQKKLFADKVIAAAEMETAEANYNVARQDVAAARANVSASGYGVESAQANLRDAAVNLRKTTIYAPANGTVSKLSVEPGERVLGTSQMAGTELMRIANLNHMEVRINVNENDIVRVSLGDSAIIDVDAYTYSGRKFKGIVTAIANTANGAGGNLAAAAAAADGVTEFEVKIKMLPESYRDLVDRKNKRSFPFRPGMTASVDIITERRPQVLSVPIAAVTTRSKDDPAPTDAPEAPKVEDTRTKKRSDDTPTEVVFVNKGGIAQQRQVKTGISDFENIEVLSGLQPGEEVVSGPFLMVSKTLKNGDRIGLKKDRPDKKK